MARTKLGSSRSGAASGATRSARAPKGSEQSDFLENIDKLLNAVFGLMKQEPAFDRQTFEHLRRLRVRVRDALAARQSEFREAKIPKKWLDRVDKRESPVDFIRREYGELIGKISRPDIKRMDKSLYAALHNWISEHGELPADLDLPTKKQQNDRKLEKLGKIRSPTRSLWVSEMPPIVAEQLRLYDVARQRKKRQSD
jgi:hypothetical protein